MSAKADLVLQATDIVRECIAEQVKRLGMSTQPVGQWFGPPLSSAEMLFLVSQNPAKLNHILQHVPEPPQNTGLVQHTRRSKMRAGEAV